jgi:murein DD-endopeptidase MepM/ murein hydrolase activator NlpD
MKKYLASLFIVFCLFGTAVLWSEEASTPFGIDESQIKKSDDGARVVISAEEKTSEAAAAEVKKEEEKKKEEKEKKEKEEKEKSAANSDPDVFSPPIYGTVEVGNSSLNVRTGEWDTVVDSLYTGNRVKIVGKKGVWYKAEINGQIRFIHMNYVSTSHKPAGSTPVVYPWANSASASEAGVIISQKSKDSSGWGGVFPNEPPAKYISSPYGYRTHPVTGKASTFHKGVDLPCVSGSRVNALANGVVVATGYDNGGGNYLKIRYANGYETMYYHLLKNFVKKGDNVSAGEKVALGDNTGVYTTGSHLHLEVWYNGQTTDPQKLGIPLVK